MKVLVVFSAALALSGATQVAGPLPSAKNVQQGKVVSNELLRTNRRIFSGGWGGSAGGDSGYRSGPPPGLDGSLMSLFNAMSSFGINPNSNYGPPGSGGGKPPPSSQYGPPGSGSGGPPISEYGAPPNGGSGGKPPSSQYGPPGSGGGANGGYSGGQGGLRSGLIAGGIRAAAPSRGVALGQGAGLRNAPVGQGLDGVSAGPDGGRIFRYVSLFTAPEEPAPTRPKVIRAGPATPDKHVNIIFVKPPSAPAEQPTEVVLSPEPERKTIVYVLMKKPSEDKETVRVRPALPTQPPKPEVYFIPYTDPNGLGGPGGQGGPEGALRNAGGNTDGGYSDGGNGVGGAQGPGGPSGGYDDNNAGGGGLRGLGADGAIEISSGIGVNGYD